MKKLVKIIMPDSYVASIYDVHYGKLYDNGIRFAVFDIDCTILPFDDVKVPQKPISFFRDLKELGLTLGLCSNGSLKRVRPVGEALDVKYIAQAQKPFKCSFERLKGMFGSECTPDNTAFIGDSFYLDMIFADKCGMYKIMVDALHDGFNSKAFVNDFLQATLVASMKKSGFQYKKYYHGRREK